MEFREYLHRQGYAKSTVETYARNKNFFVRWCDQKGYKPFEMEYKDCLEYVKKLRREKPTKSTVRHIVGSLKIYFNYLVEIEHRFDNPVQSINIRGVSRTLNHNLLEFDELEDLYYSYRTENLASFDDVSVAIRNKVIVGLMVYQGLSTTTLRALQYEHIQLEKGRIYVPSTRNSNSRVLELKPQQMIPIIQYLEKHRELLQDKLHNYSNDLFLCNTEKLALISRVFTKLKKTNHKVTNNKQLRASVISHWLKSINIREVQYMAGHRYISSTERYLQDDLESLHDLIENLHPIS
ncbi:tyrosine-type recombinase/integrase [Pseudotenacibaculum haliotis]|uniref:Tyrosine-type recombinase/integrase n=1 Tax=Pseudotenacibaculum haliotis TaxID=1862138 RepID=A0ABW5LM06_9FLAO